MIYHKENRFIHHVHIPKCAGTSISTMLKSCGWEELNLAVPEHLTHTVRTTFNKDGKMYTDHAHREIWQCWNVEPEFRFAVIRNPYSKFISQCRQVILNAHEIVPPPKGFAHQPNADVLVDLFPMWEHGVTYTTKQDDGTIAVWGGPGDEDNHYRPQVDFLREDVSCYGLENHMDDLIADLTSRGIIPNGTELPRENRSEVPVVIPWRDSEYAEFHAKFKLLYKTDFHVFGYEMKQADDKFAVDWS